MTITPAERRKAEMSVTMSDAQFEALLSKLSPLQEDTALTFCKAEFDGTKDTEVKEAFLAAVTVFMFEKKTEGIIMIPDKQCGLFHRTEDEVNAVRQVFGLTEKSIKEGVDSIMEWFQKQPHLVHIEMSREAMEMMIIIAKGSIERAKEKIDNLYKYRFLHPELIQNRSQIFSGDKVFDLYNVFVLPKLQDNRRISIVRFREDISKLDIEELFRRVFMLLDLRMIYDYMAGDIWILDFENVGWVQILTQNPLVFAKVARFFTKCLNWRMYGIHVINLAGPTNITQRIVNFFKQFVTSIIMDRVVIHENLEDLYNYVPKECLPKDYGGNELSSDELEEITENVYRNPKIAEYLLECSKMASNESLRPRDENSEEFLSGTFRQLDVD